MSRMHLGALAVLAASTLGSTAPAFAQQPAVAVPVPVQSNPFPGGGVVATGSLAPQGFSVVLVLGEMQGNGATDSVPAAARKALADMKDFLPYKSYRFLDTQWTLCCGRSPNANRLRGPDEQDYDLELSPSSTGPDGKVAVRFILREPAASSALIESASAAGASEAAEQKRAVERMEARLKTLRESYTEGHPEARRLQAEIAETESALNRERVRAQQLSAAQRGATAARMASETRSNARPIIDTSFTMDIGETVVVGTSRVKGDKALIALLTAVPSSKTTTR
jgi:hypothetical protein